MLAPAALVSDPDSPDFAGGSLSVVITSGATSGDVLRLVGRSLFATDGNELYYGELHVGRIFFGDFESPLFVAFNGNMTPEIAQALVRAVTFSSTSNMIAPRTVEFILDDGHGEEQGEGGVSSATAQVTFAADTTVARDDAVATGEDTVLIGDLFADNGNGADFDPNGTNEVTAVNGVTTHVGQTFELPSGALLTVNEDGTFTYDPNGRYEALVPFGSGAANDKATDSFTYTVGGESTATVTVTIMGAADDVNTFQGTQGNDTITGTSFRDIFLLQSGGADHVSGQGGNDTFYFGPSFNVENNRGPNPTPGDRVSGGEGTDAIILQGQYVLTLGDAEFDTTIIEGIESISLAPGNYTGFGGTGEGFTSYNITTIDENVLAGDVLKFNGYLLRVGENFTFNGSDELDGQLILFAGKGTENLTGGAGNDIFIFGPDGRFAANDVVAGGGGYDSVYLFGDYTIDFNAAGFAGALNGIESLFLASFFEDQFVSDGDGEFDYSIVWNDALPVGARMTINGSSLRAAESMSFDGSTESQTSFRLFGGAANDTLRGGLVSDSIYGGGGGDSLTGNLGNDVFLYYATTDSRSANDHDTIQDFRIGDLIDLSVIDANVNLDGDQAFTWIGFGAFTGQAGQLRYDGARVAEVAGPLGPSYWIEGDVDGNGSADFYIAVTKIDGGFTAADFIL